MIIVAGSAIGRGRQIPRVPTGIGRCRLRLWRGFGWARLPLVRNAIAVFLPMLLRPKVGSERTVCKTTAYCVGILEERGGLEPSLGRPRQAQHDARKTSNNPRGRTVQLVPATTPPELLGFLPDPNNLLLDHQVRFQTLSLFRRLQGCLVCTLLDLLWP